MLKIFSFFFFLIVSAYGNDYEKLFLEAQLLENNKSFEKSSLIYKKIAIDASKDKLVENSGLQRQRKIVKERFDLFSNLETSLTFDQILNKKFDLYSHEDNYFLPLNYTSDVFDDRKQSEAKFQLSIQKPLSFNLFGLNESINLAYTQTSWWQIYEESSPFRESNYKPELFVVLPSFSDKLYLIKAYKFGLVHESNGRDGNKSRSWNRIYTQGVFQFGNVFSALKVWYRFSEKDDNNKDITDYYGYGDLTTFYIDGKNLYKIILRNNLKIDSNNKGSFQLNWTFPFLNSKSTFAYFQVFSGYGSSLIDYDKNINSFGFGISLSR